MEKLTVRQGNSYWKGTLAEIVKWASGPAYNDVMKQRQEAAKKFLASCGLL